MAQWNLDEKSLPKCVGKQWTKQQSSHTKMKVNKL